MKCFELVFVGFIVRVNGMEWKVRKVGHTLYFWGEGNESEVKVMKSQCERGYYGI